MTNDSTEAVPGLDQTWRQILHVFGGWDTRRWENPTSTQPYDQHHEAEVGKLDLLAADLGALRVTWGADCERLYKTVRFAGIPLSPYGWQKPSAYQAVEQAKRQSHGGVGIILDHARSLYYRQRCEFIVSAPYLNWCREPQHFAELATIRDAFSEIGLDIRAIPWCGYNNHACGLLFWHRANTFAQASVDRLSRVFPLRQEHRMTRPTLSLKKSIKTEIAPKPKAKRKVAKPKVEPEPTAEPEPAEKSRTALAREAVSFLAGLGLPLFERMDKTGVLMPMAFGIREDVLARTDPALYREVCQALTAIASSSVYHQAILTMGARRRTVDNDDTGPVTFEHRRFARSLLFGERPMIAADIGLPAGE